VANHDLISSEEYANIIGKTARWVRKNYEKYGGVYAKGKSRGGNSGKILLFPRPESSPASSGTHDCVSPSIPVVVMPEAVGECLAPIIDRSEQYPLEFFNYSELKRQEAIQKKSVLEAWGRSECSAEQFIQLNAYKYPLINVTRKNLYTWEKQYEDKNIIGLVNKSGNYAGKQHVITPWMEEFLIEQIKVANIGYSYTRVQRELHQHAERLSNGGYRFSAFLKKKPGSQLVSIKAVQTFIDKYAKVHPLEAYQWLNGLDKSTNKFDMALGDSTEEALYPLHIVEIDASPLDAIVMRNGEQSRMALLQMVDLFTGRIVALVADTSNAVSISRLLKKFVLKLGKPTVIRGDNGKEFISKAFIGSVAALGIEYRNCNPYEHREKGTVERSFTYVQHQLLPTLPGYIGKNVSERMKIEAQIPKKDRLSGAMTNNAVPYDHEELQVIIDEFLDIRHDNTYHNRLDMTPLEKWNSDTTARETIRAEVLDKLLGRRFERTVGKKGLKLNNRLYISGEMGDYVGQTITAIEDMDTPSRLYCYQGEELLFLAFDKEILTQEEKIAAAAKAKKLGRKQINKAAKAKNEATAKYHALMRESYTTLQNSLNAEEKAELNRSVPTKKAKADAEHSANNHRAEIQLQRQKHADANPMLITPRVPKAQKKPEDYWEAFYLNGGGKAVGQ